MQAPQVLKAFRDCVRNTHREFGDFLSVRRRFEEARIEFRAAMDATTQGDPLAHAK